MKNELKDLVFEALVLLITGGMVILLTIYTDLGKWPVILLGVGVGIGAITLIRSKRKS